MKRLALACATLLAIAFAASGCGAYRAAQANAGWVTLIDGARGLENFDRVGTANWTAAEGAIQADSGGKDPAYLVTRESYRDFMIRAEFWASVDANSGIFMRCADPKKIGDESCYEANIFDQRPDPTYATGSIVKVAPVSVSPPPQAGGKWNLYEITVAGPRIVVKLNGQKTVDVEDRKLESGPIALQWGKGMVKFRKVQVKRL
jgi:hypothetical protein